MSNLLVRGMLGFGDNLYQVPIVQMLAKKHGGLTLSTTIPGIYRGIEGVQCCRADTTLRTQSAHLAMLRGLSPWPSRGGHQAKEHLRLRYQPQEVRRGATMLSSLARSVELHPTRFEWPTITLGDNGAVSAQLPQPIEAALALGKRIAMVRPVTLRTEWVAASRNPDPSYVDRAAKIAKEWGFTVVSVTWVRRGEEDYVGEPPLADIRFDRGELTALQMLELTRSSAVVIGGVGWIVPAALAFGRPTIVVHGGNGGYNRPAVLSDPRVAIDRMTHLVPDRYCMCIEAEHVCLSKTISDFDEKVAEALRAIP